MSDPFLAEIRIFAGSFAPRTWAACNGQLLPISQNTALFSLLGVQYGGDGRSTFALPNLQGAAPMHTTQFSSSPFGQFPIGAAGGSQTVTLQSSQMPSHSHSLNGKVVSGTVGAGSTASMAEPSNPSSLVYQSSATQFTPMNPAAVGSMGGNGAHNNMQPYLALTFIIALQGVFPPRS